METRQFLQYNQDGRTTRFIIGSKEVFAPVFAPEIKNAEDLEVLLRFEKALDKNNPIMVPPNLWNRLVHNPRFKKRTYDRLSLVELVHSHPVLFYEPPELFRYKMPEVLLSYALDTSRKREFIRQLEKGNIDAALDILPPVYRIFMRYQLYELCKILYNNEKIRTMPDIQRSSKRVDDGWWDQEIDTAFPAYILEILLTALKLPDAAIIPPVPVISTKTKGAGLRRTLGINAMTSYICKNYGQGKVYSYFHIYIDWRILDPLQNASHQILEAIENGLSVGDYCGVALTISGYEKMCQFGKFNVLESFIGDVVNISHENHLPVILPRSGWYGLYFTDYGIQAFGSLLNGAERYTPIGRGSQEDQYGKVPIYGLCVELRYRELMVYLKTHKELPEIPGLPRRPDPDTIGNPRRFRILFGKPWRLMHCQEAREVRAGLSTGVRSPAKRYLERSKHPYLKSL